MTTIFTRVDGRSVRLAAGMTAGLLAGTTMITLALLLSFAQGSGFWFPAQLMGAALFGVIAILGGTAPAITGLLLHLVWSSILGGIFGSMVSRSNTTGETIGAGLLFGVVVWAIMTYAVLPWANPTLADRVALFPNWWFICHVTYGAVLGSAGPLLRSFTRADVDRYSEWRQKAA